eukprot:m.108887 g.108887  ORF g.108887 m.108887 type:complete len:544 (-) comp15942_c2_seq1:36-1667(-)
MSEVPADAAGDDAEVVAAGWLMKKCRFQGDRKPWKRRFFSLVGGTVLYQHSPPPSLAPPHSDAVAATGQATAGSSLSRLRRWSSRSQVTCEDRTLGAVLQHGGTKVFVQLREGTTVEPINVGNGKGTHQPAKLGRRRCSNTGSGGGGGGGGGGGAHGGGYGLKIIVPGLSDPHLGQSDDEGEGCGVQAGPSTCRDQAGDVRQKGGSDAGQRGGSDVQAKSKACRGRVGVGAGAGGGRAQANVDATGGAGAGDGGRNADGGGGDDDDSNLEDHAEQADDGSNLKDHAEQAVAACNGAMTRSGCGAGRATAKTEFFLAAGSQQDRDRWLEQLRVAVGQPLVTADTCSGLCDDTSAPPSRGVRWKMALASKVATSTVGKAVIRRYLDEETNSLLDALLGLAREDAGSCTARAFETTLFDMVARMAVIVREHRIPKHLDLTILAKETTNFCQDFLMYARDELLKAKRVGFERQPVDVPELLRAASVIMHTWRAILEPNAPAKTIEQCNQLAQWYFNGERLKQVLTNDKYRPYLRVINDNLRAIVETY